MNKMIKRLGTQTSSSQRLHLRATTIRVLKSRELAAAVGGYKTRHHGGGDGGGDGGTPPTSFAEENQCQTA